MNRLVRRASPSPGYKKTPPTRVCQGREPSGFVVPPCFTRPSRRRALSGTDIPYRCDGRTRRDLGPFRPSPTRLRGHVQRVPPCPFPAPRALCAVAARLLSPSLPLPCYAVCHPPLGVDFLEAVLIAKVFRFASQNCRWQGEKSREYFVYFKIFQRSQRQFGPLSWVLRRLVQFLIV